MAKKLSKVLSLCLAAALTAGMVGCSNSSSQKAGTTPAVTDSAKENEVTKAADEKKDTKESTTPFDISMQLIFWGAEVPTEKPELLKQLESELNVNLELNYVLAANAKEKTTTTISGGDDMPDVLCIINDIMRSQIVQDAGEAGMFWDIKDYLNDYPNLKENIEPFKNSMTYGGKIIGIPRRTLDRAGGLLLRQDWLDKLNLEMPKTLDDFYNVFHAFTYDDPDGNGVDDTTGLAMFGGAYVRPLMIAAGVNYDWYVDEQTGKVQNFCQEKNFQSYLDFIKKLYDEGLVSQDFAAMNATQGREVFNTQKAGAYTANYGNISGGDAYKALYDANSNAKIVAITDVIQPDGTHACETSPGFYGMYVIPKNSVKTEEQLRGILSFFDSLCTEKYIDLELMGNEGEHYKYDADKKFQWIDVAKFNADAKGLNCFSVAPLITLKMKLGGFDNAETYYNFQSQENVKDYRPITSWFVTNSDDAAVDTVVKEAATKYVMGEVDADAVSAAIKEWLDGGGQSHADDWTEQYSKLVK